MVVIGSSLELSPYFSSVLLSCAGLVLLSSVTTESVFYVDLATAIEPSLGGTLINSWNVCRLLLFLQGSSDPFWNSSDFHHTWTHIVSIKSSEFNIVHRLLLLCHSSLCALDCGASISYPIAYITASPRRCSVSNSGLN